MLFPRTTSSCVFFEAKTQSTLHCTLWQMRSGTLDLWWSFEDFFYEKFKRSSRQSKGSSIWINRVPWAMWIADDVKVKISSLSFLKSLVFSSRKIHLKFCRSKIERPLYSIRRSFCVNFMDIVSKRIHRDVLYFQRFTQVSCAPFQTYTWAYSSSVQTQGPLHSGSRG